MWEKAIDILRSDSFWREVVHFLDSASFKHLSLLWNFLLDKLVNLRLQVVLLIDNFVCLGIALLHGWLSGLCEILIVGCRRAICANFIVMSLPATLANLSNLFVKQILIVTNVVLAASTQLFLSATVSRTLNLKLIFIAELQ